MNKNKIFFTNALLLWNKKDNNRIMPWKGEKDPYKIWLSEIILQQTRVEQGSDYYKRFLTDYPSIEQLANAPEKKIFKLWEGLGYYTRCKNLLATARIVMKVHKGKFPSTYEEILSLKGVGPYTAAAIASFAFNLPHAALDGNVFRVLSRFFGIALPVNSTAGKQIFTALAHELLDKNEPGIYNQAIMDFGAVICKPKNPLCGICPQRRKCIAYRQDRVADLPVKDKGKVRRSRWLYYLMVQHNGRTYVRKRTAKDIWENLYEFILLETPEACTVEKIMEEALSKKILRKSDMTIINISRSYLQQLTHQTIQGCFIHIKTKRALRLSAYEAVSASQIIQMPFPKFITKYLAENEGKSFER
jgi:A/G-specific adenine glycosylase